MNPALKKTLIWGVGLAALAAAGYFFIKGSGSNGMLDVKLSPADKFMFDVNNPATQVGAEFGAYVAANPGQTLSNLAAYHITQQTPQFMAYLSRAEWNASDRVTY